MDISKIAEKTGYSETKIRELIKSLNERDDIRNSGIDIVKRDKMTSIDDLNVGEVVTGKVRNITDFGAFVDIGIKDDGLVHKSRISDDFVTDIFKYVKVGDTVKVIVIDIDKKTNRVSLSMRKSDINC